MSPNKKSGGLPEPINSLSATGSKPAQPACGPAVDVNLLSIILEDLPEGISVHDHEYNIILTNPAMKELFPDKLPMEGKKCYAAFFGLSRPCEDCACSRTMRTGVRQSKISKVTLPSTGPIWLETKAYPILDENKIVAGVITQHCNITERKELETARSQAELYVDLMSHDINNMNQLALGSLEMLQAELQTPEQRGRLSSSIEILNSISGLIRNVNMLKIVSGEEMKLEPVDISQVLTKVVERYASIPGKTINISYEIVPGSLVLANGLIADVFSNLIHNAIKHSPGKNILINILLSALKKDDRWFYRVAVEDNGPGITDDQKEAILERLTKRDQKLSGKGLGLYIVKALIDRYNGQLWVEDRVRGDYTRGSKFIVLLPAI